MCAAWRSLDPEHQLTDDIPRAERQLAELESRPWKSEAGRLEIRRQIEILERDLPGMRENAEDAA